MLRKTLIVVLTMLCMTNLTAYAAHPSDGHESENIELLYTGNCGMPVEWSFGNVQLTDRRVPLAELTSEECYILAGVKTCRWSDEAGLEPWKITLFSIVNKFVKAHGYIPDQMTPELIRSIPGYENTSDDRLDLYRSPITDDWPKLNCEAFNPGNVYMVKLTPAEIDHFAELIPEYAEMWGDNCWWDPSDGEYKCIDIKTPIYFMRIYGQTGVLYEGIDFVWHVYD